ncbi:uncharacterized protein LOC119178793 isoform X1 [Rhipicephalus microplus]|uniref:uncharacterized protein LOC119178793 isoform X1 n=1 Tax=Rhipicephalus microplus TaxID=6941 RepID=UPI003F6C9A90
MGMLKADGVHPTKHGSQLLGCLLRAAIKQASKDLEASHNGALQQQHQKEKDHKKLRFQYSDQSKGLAQYWNNVTNFPALSTDPMLVVAPASPCKEMWSDVARKSDSASIQCHSAMSVTPKVAETDTAHGYPSLPITAVACTRASAVTVFAQVERHPVRAPALVGGVWMQHKVKKTGRTAVPLCSAAFEQSPLSDCGPPDACGVTSTVSPQSEGVVLCKGSSAADTSASTPRGEQKATSAKLSQSHICTGGGNLSVGSTFSTYKECKASFEGWKSEGFHPMRIEKSDKNPLCTEKDLNKADFPYVRVKFVCCHAGHPNPRGQNIRPNQRFNGTGCNVELKLALRVSPQPYYEVVNLADVHNHKIGPEIFVWYNNNRALSASEKEQFQELISCNVKPKDLKDAILRKTGKHVTSRDIINMKHRTVLKIQDNAHHGALLLEKINELFSENSGWKVHIEKNTENGLLYILLQSKHTAQLLEKYPEVLFFDGTYKVNKEGYILHSILCEDGTSHGRPVCYAFVQRETSEVLVFPRDIPLFESCRRGEVHNCGNGQRFK